MYQRKIENVQPSQIRTWTRKKWNTYNVFILGYQKPTTLFFSLPTGNSSGQHGLLGEESVDGYYATFCASQGNCGSQGYDFFNFSTSAQYPSNVPCGFYSYSSGFFTGWDDCPDGDNIQQMRYFIRYWYVIVTNIYLISKDEIGSWCGTVTLCSLLVFLFAKRCQDSWNSLSWGKYFPL